MRGASTLKSVSRRRSDVGRTCIEGGLRRFRPRYIPAITRILLFSKDERPEALSLTCSTVFIKTETRIALPDRVHTTQPAKSIMHIMLAMMLCDQHAAATPEQRSTAEEPEHGRVIGLVGRVEKDYVPEPGVRCAA